MRRKRTIGVVLGAAVVLVIGIVAGFQVGLLGGDTPAEATLSSPTATAGATTEGTGSGSTTTGETWTVDTSSGRLDDGTSTFAGYRIQEELGGVGSNTAVGRTQSVTGDMTIEGTTITGLTIEVGMTTLVSDDDRRDGQLQERGLETSAFPTATFVLAEPIELAHVPSGGETVEEDAVGDLTLHGVTRRVTAPIQARTTGDTIEAVASFDVALADYDIEPPTGFLVLSIADTGTVEMHLLFVPA